MMEKPEKIVKLFKRKARVRNEVSESMNFINKDLNNNMKSCAENENKPSSEIVTLEHKVLNLDVYQCSNSTVSIKPNMRQKGKSKLPKWFQASS